MDLQHVHLLTPGMKGVTIPKLILFAKLNNIPLRIFTTDDLSLEHNVGAKVPITPETLVVLSHHGHAWLGVEPIFDKDEAARPMDCHCGYCVALKKTHDPTKCNVCRSRPDLKYEKTKPVSQARTFEELVALRTQMLKKVMKKPWSLVNKMYEDD